MCACKWHIIPRNVYHKWSSSRVDPRPPFCLASSLMICLCASPKSVKRGLFADDDTPNTPNDNTNTILRDFQQSVNNVSDRCCTNLMALNPTKTKRVLTATSQKHQKGKLTLNSSLLTTPVEQVSEHRILEVTIDEQLKRQTRINNSHRTVSSNSFLLSKLNEITSHQAKLPFFFAHIM